MSVGIDDVYAFNAQPPGSHLSSQFDEWVLKDDSFESYCFPGLTFLCMSVWLSGGLCILRVDGHYIVSLPSSRHRVLVPVLFALKYHF